MLSNVKAVLWEKKENNYVQCNICHNHCLIAPGKMSRCNSRMNMDGEMKLSTFGLVSSIAADPIEKKPLYHFHPGTRVLSVGSWGCNFNCLHCQNCEISQVSDEKKIMIKNGEKVGGHYIFPKNLVDLALQHDCKGVSWTYNEPTIWLEYTIESAKLAKEKGLYTAYVTNSFITSEALGLISPYLDAFRADVKSFDDKFYSQVCGVKNGTRIFDTILYAKQLGMHIEAVTNIIPGHNDSDENLRNIARWISDNISENTPWHVSRFFPLNKMKHIQPTPVETLQKAYEIGTQERLNHIYIGNLGTQNNTVCPKCNNTAIKRDGGISLNLNDAGGCSVCGNDLNIVVP